MEACTERFIPIRCAFRLPQPETLLLKRIVYWISLCWYVEDDEIFYSYLSSIAIFPNFSIPHFFSENSIQFHSSEMLFLSTGHPFRRTRALLNLKLLCRFPTAHLAQSIPIRGFKPMKNNSLKLELCFPTHTRVDPI